MNHSESIGAISAALAKAQGAIEGAAKTADNPAFKRDGKALKYADLASVWDACRAELAANQIAVVQAPGCAASGVVEMTTMLCHSSGEWFSGTLTIPLSKVDAHGYGSAITYARRYALAAMVGIAPAEDDGNAASAIGGENRARGSARIDDAQWAALVQMIEVKQADTLKFCRYLKVPSLRDLPAADFDQAMAALKAKPDPKPAEPLKEAA